MDREMALLGLTLLATALALGQWVLRRRRAERPHGAPDGGTFRYTTFLSVFLPLVGLLTALQLYMEARRIAYLLLAGFAALVLAVTLLAARSGARDRKPGPGR